MKRNQQTNADAKQQASKFITITVEEYNHLTHMANLLEVIMHDHTAYHDSVHIVKNLLNHHGMLKEAGVEQ